MAMNAINAGLSGAASGAAAGPWGAIAGAAAGLLGGGIGAIVGHAKANKTAKNLNEQARQANLAKSQALISKVNALDQANDQRAMAAYAAFGGSLGNTPQFPEFPTDVVEFNNGGSHEENPYDGIPQGIAPDGMPNLVEEGEVKYNDYIYSDRLMLNKEDKKKYKFLKGDTYAKAADNIAKESKERPNDWISKNTLEANLGILEDLQEQERRKRGLKGENRMMYKNGGHIFDALSPVTIDDAQVQAASDAWEKYAHATLDAELARQALGELPNTKNTKNPFAWSSLGQAMPAVGSALGVLTSAISKPTYEHAKALQEGENTNFTPITYTPLTQKMTYKPFDVNYYGNKLGAQAGATRRAIAEQTATNPYAATAALLSADANAQGQLGDLYKKAEEYNLAQREKVNTFNRATDSANAEMAMKAQQANASLLDSRAKRQLERDTMAAKLRTAEDQAWSESMSSNLTGLFDNLGAIGKEDKEFALAALKMMSEGKMTPEQIQAYSKNFPQLKKYLGSYGGRLKKKKGYTI
jgi:hypothetical protein